MMGIAMVAKTIDLLQREADKNDFMVFVSNVSVSAQIADGVALCAYAFGAYETKARQIAQDKFKIAIFCGKDFELARLSGFFAQDCENAPLDSEIFAQITEPLELLKELQRFMSIFSLVYAGNFNAALRRQYQAMEFNALAQRANLSNWQEILKEFANGNFACLNSLSKQGGYPRPKVIEQVGKFLCAKRQNLSEIFSCKNELDEFVAQSVDCIGDVLGLHLESAEQKGDEIEFRYFDDVVIVESEFGRTSGSYLGRIVERVVRKNAKYVIWIANSVEHKHKMAIEWLNGHFEDRVKFFALELGFICIDGKCAPDFKVAVGAWNEKEFWAEFEKYAYYNGNLKDYAFVNGCVSGLSLRICDSVSIELQCDSNKVSAVICARSVKSARALAENKKLVVREVGAMAQEYKSGNAWFKLEFELGVGAAHKLKWSEIFAWYCEMLPKLKNVCDKYLVQ